MMSLGQFAFLKKIYLSIYLFIWLRRLFIAACRIFSCGMRESFNCGMRESFNCGMRDLVP